MAVHTLKEEWRDDAEEEVRAAVAEKYGRIEDVQRRLFDELGEFICRVPIKPEWARDPESALALLQESIDRIEPVPEQMTFDQVSELSDWIAGFVNSLHGLGINSTKLERVLRAQRIAMVHYWTVANEAYCSLDSAADTVRRSAGILKAHRGPMTMHRG